MDISVAGGGARIGVGFDWCCWIHSVPECNLRIFLFPTNPIQRILLVFLALAPTPSAGSRNDASTPCIGRCVIDVFMCAVRELDCCAFVVAIGKSNIENKTSDAPHYYHPILLYEVRSIIFAVATTDSSAILLYVLVRIGIKNAQRNARGMKPVSIGIHQTAHAARVGANFVE